MMKINIPTIKVLHTVIGFIPFVWLVVFLTILGVGTISLGYIPEYGNKIDPSALSLDFLGYFNFIFWVLGFIGFWFWIVLTMVMIVFFKVKITTIKTSTIFFIVGATGYFLFNNVYTANFLWVFD